MQKNANYIYWSVMILFNGGTEMRGRMATPASISYILMLLKWFLCYRLELFDGLFPFDFKTQASMSSPKYLGKENNTFVWKGFWNEITLVPILNKIPWRFWGQFLLFISMLLVILLSMELTYFISGLLFAAIVKKRIWDYSVTVTLSHVVLSSAREYSK